MISDKVYKPSHDSFILLSTLQQIVQNNELVDARNFLEIGSGSGYVTLNLCRLICNNSRYMIMIDVEQYAVYSSWLSIKRNNMDVYVDVAQCDAASCIRSNSIDVIYFNPPYLPVCDDFPEAIAWNGGEQGVEVWSKFFENSLKICKNQCIIIFVFSSLQNIEKIIHQISSLDTEINQCQNFFYESICTIVVRK